MSEYAERDAQAWILTEVGELLFGESEFSAEDIPQKLRETWRGFEDECKELTKQRDEAFASFRDNMHRIGAAEGMHAREFDRARAAESVAEKLYDALCASGGVSALTKANASALMATLAKVKPLDFDRSEEATEWQSSLPFRAGDSVQVHNADGTLFEEWLLAADERDGRVACCGWPESVMDASRCVCTRRATNVERLKMLANVSRLEGLRGSWARMDLQKETTGKWLKGPK